MRRPLGAVLAPGASAGRDQPALVSLDRALSSAGLAVERMDFPYRLAGRRAPDRPSVLVAAVEEAAQKLADRLGTGTARLVLGGRSMGGRMCSMVVAQGMPAAALLLVSYPLHPPGRPDRLRVEHFPDLTVPCFFVSGTRDPFGTPEELEKATGTIGGPVTHHWVDGGDHALRAKDQQVVEAVLLWLEQLGD
ncbi:MAG TPA: alpha/beta family hydrolase [Acidimicrobiales bacterium]|nr:alpha/beta family hydrolase [Acidimicrobiales bacterium]